MTRARPKQHWWHQLNRAASAQWKRWRRRQQAGGSTQECSQVAIALQKGVGGLNSTSAGWSLEDRLAQEGIPHRRVAVCLRGAGNTAARRCQPGETFTCGGARSGRS